MGCADPPPPALYAQASARLRPGRP